MGRTRFLSEIAPQQQLPQQLDQQQQRLPHPRFPLPLPLSLPHPHVDVNLSLGVSGGTGAAIAFAVILVLITTRLITGFISYQCRRQNHHPGGISTDGAKPPPLVPYWVPFLGHVPNFIFEKDRFMNRLRAEHPEGLAAIKLFGTTHIFIFRHGLGTSLLSKPPSVAHGEWARHQILNKGFGYPRGELAEYVRMSHDWQDLFTRNLLSGSGLARMVSCTTDKMLQNMSSFVTFRPDWASQTPWERSGKTSLILSPYTGDGPIVETSLADLIRSFVGHSANPSLVGEDFMDNFPHFWELLWDFTETWILLVLGLPKWFDLVWPKLARATAALDEMLRCVREYEVALEKWHKGQDPGLRWRRLDTVSDLIQSRMPLYMARGVSFEARAANELALIWAMNVNSNMLVFWMVFRLVSHPTLLDQVREEVAPFLAFSKHDDDYKSEGGVDHPDKPRSLKHVNIEGLLYCCPVLKATYVESLRLDNSSWAFKQAKKEFVLTDRLKNNGQKFLIPKGAYAHVVEELRNTDPRSYTDPLEWRAERHITMEKGSPEDAEKAEMVPVAKMGEVRAYGAGSQMCPGRNFALKEAMTFTAAIVSMYDIQPAGGGTEWNIKPEKSVGIKTLVEPLRVWVRRRCT